MSKQLEKVTREMSKSRNRYNLTEGQENFARLVAEYPDQPLVDSYLMAFPNFDGSRKTGYEVASRTMRLDKVRERVEMIRTALVGTCPLGLIEGLSILAEIARDRGYQAETRMKAVRNIGDLSGWMTQDMDRPPDRIEVVVVTESRDRPVRDIDVNAIEVTDV